MARSFGFFTFSSSDSTIPSFLTTFPSFLFSSKSSDIDRNFSATEKLTKIILFISFVFFPCCLCDSIFFGFRNFNHGPLTSLTSTSKLSGIVQYFAVFSTTKSKVTYDIYSTSSTASIESSFFGLPPFLFVTAEGISKNKKDGLNDKCVDCDQTNNDEITGKRYERYSEYGNVVKEDLDLNKKDDTKSDKNKANLKYKNQREKEGEHNLKTDGVDEGENEISGQHTEKRKQQAERELNKSVSKELDENEELGKTSTLENKGTNKSKEDEKNVKEREKNSPRNEIKKNSYGQKNRVEKEERVKNDIGKGVHVRSERSVKSEEENNTVDHNKQRKNEDVISIPRSEHITTDDFDEDDWNESVFGTVSKKVRKTMHSYLSYVKGYLMGFCICRHMYKNSNNVYHYLIENIYLNHLFRMNYTLFNYVKAYIYEHFLCNVYEKVQVYLNRLYQNMTTLHDNYTDSIIRTSFYDVKMNQNDDENNLYSVHRSKLGKYLSASFQFLYVYLVKDNRILTKLKYFLLSKYISIFDEEAVEYTRTNNYGNTLFKEMLLIDKFPFSDFHKRKFKNISRSSLLSSSVTSSPHSLSTHISPFFTKNTKKKDSALERANNNKDVMRVGRDVEDDNSNDTHENGLERNKNDERYDNSVNRNSNHGSLIETLSYRYIFNIHFYVNIFVYFYEVLQPWSFEWPKSTFLDCLYTPSLRKLYQDAEYINPILYRLKRRTFFRIFKLKFNASCFIHDWEDSCKDPEKCGLCECSQDQIPPLFLKKPEEHFVDRRQSASFERWQSSEHSPDGPYSMFEKKRQANANNTESNNKTDSASKKPISKQNNEKPIYVDLNLNPPSFTNYQGGEIWSIIYNSIYGEIESEKKRKNINVSVSSIKDIPESIRTQYECMSSRNLQRLVSGMQSNIVVFASKNHQLVSHPHEELSPKFSIDPHDNYYNEKGSMGDFIEGARMKMPSAFFLSSDPPKPIFFSNLRFAYERLGWHPDYLQNLFFTFSVLLKALCKLQSVLQECSCETGNNADDLAARADLLQLLNATSTDLNACQTQYLDHIIFDANHLLFLENMEKIDQLLHCVPCEKCQLHGKIKLTALYIGSKMASTGGKLPILERNEVTALINALYYFSESILLLKQIERQFFYRNISVYLIFSLFFLFLCMVVKYLVIRPFAKLCSYPWKCVIIIKTYLKKLEKAEEKILKKE